VAAKRHPSVEFTPDEYRMICIYSKKARGRFGFLGAAHGGGSKEVKDGLVNTGYEGCVGRWRGGGLGLVDVWSVAEEGTHVGISEVVVIKIGFVDVKLAVGKVSPTTSVGDGAFGATDVHLIRFVKHSFTLDGDYAIVFFFKHDRRKA